MDRTCRDQRRDAVLSTESSVLSNQHSVLRTRNSELRTRNFAFLLLALLAITGCSTTSLFSKFAPKNKFAKATPQNPAVRCLCLWEPSEGTGADNKPARGVSGQIFFFTRGEASSVEVEGDVRVFLFDDFGVADAQAQPLHQFDFLAGSWQAHVTSTQFGPAYQLFVPYSRKGHHQAELAVRVRLAPPSGSPLYSEIAKVTLPGYERDKTNDQVEVYAPEASHTKTATNNNFANSNRITPEVVGETLLEVLAERQSSVPNNDLAVAEAPVAIGSKRQTRRGVAPSRQDSSGEINISNEPNVNHRSIARPHRLVPEKTDKVAPDNEE